MRETLGASGKKPLGQVINDSLNATLSRTLLTNANVFAVALILYFLRGKTIHDFALAMVFGSVIGTYSTLAIAASLIYERGLWVKGPGGRA